MFKIVEKFQIIVLILSSFSLISGSYFYITTDSPKASLFTTVQAAASEQVSYLGTIVTALFSLSKKTKNTLALQQNQKTISQKQADPTKASSPSSNTPITNQYITISTPYDEQKVKDTVADYLKSGSYVSLDQTDEHLYIAAAGTSSTVTSVTTSLGIPLGMDNGGTGSTSLAGARSNLGLVSGGSGDVWVDTGGDTISGQLSFSNSLSGNTIKLTPAGDSGYLSSSGGALFVNNTSNPGTGIGIYSNAGADALGNMINVKVDNPNYSQAAFYMNYDGSSNAVEIVSNANDSSSNALAVTGFNAQDSTLGIIGYENGKGTIKVTHYKNTGFSDANASGLSIDLKGAGTAAQGVYVDSTETGGTTGNLLRLRNQTIDRFVVNSLGSLSLGSAGTDTTITKTGNVTGDHFFVGTTGAFRVQRSASNSEAFRVQVNGDSQGRWLGTSDGQLKWGSGTATQDIVLRRLSAGELGLDGGLILNNSNGSIDTVIKGQTDSNLLYASASLDNIGIGISNPSRKLHVVGDIRVTGGYVDSSNSIGSSGYLLSSTGTGTSWVNGASTYFLQNGNAFGADAVLGTTDTNPLIFKTNGTEAMRLDTSGNLGIGTSSISTRLAVTGAALDTQADQSVGIANLAGSVTKNDSNTRTFYGLNIIPTLNTGGSNTTTTLNVLNVNTVNTATTGMTTNLLRLADGGTTRFLVQSAGNVVASATTSTGQAYQYNFNSITQGTGVIVNVNALTSGNGLNVTSSATAMTGSLGNFTLTGNNANDTGSILRASNTGALTAATTALFTNGGTGLSLRVNDDGTDTDSTPVVIDNAGNLGIGSTSPSQPLDVEGEIQLDMGTNQSSVALCHSGTGAAGTNNDVNIVDCTGTPGADYMEMYAVETGIEMGDIVMAGSQYITTKNGHRMVKLTKASQAYQKGVIGIVSNKDDQGDFNSIGYNIKSEDNPTPVALNGRVKVKIAASSESIEPGDYITTANDPGKGMKASRAGYMVGKALESWTPGSGQEYIMVFVSYTYADPEGLLSRLSLDSNGFLTSPRMETEFNRNTPSQLASLDTFKAELNTKLAGFEQQSSVFENRVSSLEEKVASLSANLTTSVLETSIDTSSEDLDTSILETITITKNANVNNLGITGTVTAGVLTIEGLDTNGMASINTLSGNLKLQSNTLGGLDIINGKVLIEQSGNVVITEGVLKGNKNIRGIQVPVKENDTSVEITFENKKGSADYAAVVTPSWLTQAAISHKSPEGFTVVFSQAAPGSATLDWIVIE